MAWLARILPAVGFEVFFAQTTASRKLLLRAPGVTAVTSVEPHRKGGFIALMDFDT
jgi:hypothetical protein